jgi:hypothetical protein
MKAKQFAGTVDEKTQEAEQIKSLMQAQMVNNNLMNMIAMGVGTTMPLIVQNPTLTQELDDKLKAAKRPN